VKLRHDVYANALRLSNDVFNVITLLYLDFTTSIEDITVPAMRICDQLFTKNVKKMLNFS